MNGLVISKWVQNSQGWNVPALANYLSQSMSNLDNSNNVNLVICHVEADEDDFQVMGLDKNITVLWYETAEWNLQSPFAPEFVAQYHIYGLQLGIPQTWLDEHVVVGRITQDVVNDLIQYLENTS